ncbi:MAG TPA: M23 family metallopeptidase [Rhizomicrobium sp.]|nr:M23 family metallopeptidase [Rhizomicrobium sp.]
MAAAFAPRALLAAPQRLALTGSMEQGSLVVGRGEPGCRATLDGDSIRTSPEGVFAFGLDWDQTKPAHLAVTFEDGTVETRQLDPILRKYDIQHVNGLPQHTVTPPPEALKRIRDEHTRLAAARKTDTDHLWFADPFDWPAPGIMSGVFGSQRIDNGMPMSPHFGVDMANVTGTPIHAPADAVVLLTDDFYLEGGFTLLDHGHGVFTHYMHQSKRLVSAGDGLKRGDVIGHIGMTGRATGPHLHWGMNWFQVKLDPSLSTRTPVPPRA